MQMAMFFISIFNLCCSITALVLAIRAYKRSKK